MRTENDLHTVESVIDSMKALSQTNPQQLGAWAARYQAYLDTLAAGVAHTLEPAVRQGRLLAPEANEVLRAATNGLLAILLSMEHACGLAEAA